MLYPLSWHNVFSGAASSAKGSFSEIFCSSLLDITPWTWLKCAKDKNHCVSKFKSLNHNFLYTVCVWLGQKHTSDRIEHKVYETKSTNRSWETKPVEKLGQNVERQSISIITNMDKTWYSSTLPCSKGSPHVKTSDHQLASWTRTANISQKKISVGFPCSQPHSLG